MKFRGPLFFSFLLVAFLVAAVYPQVDNAQKEAVLMRTILTFMNQLHFQPKDIDDQFSESLYDLYLDRIDGARRFLTKEDIAKLDPYKDLLDDEALAGTYNFFDLSLELLEGGIEKTQGYYKEILQQPFDFNTKEALELDGDKRIFSKNDQELKDYWRKYLKYETLTRLNRKLEDQEKTGEEGEKKSFEELEKESRKEVADMYDDWYARMAKLKRFDRLSYYLNSVTNLFDPHSVYFDPVEKQNFDIRFSGKLEGIGARLQSDGAYTKVIEVVVGGPAWKGKELQEGDLITKVAQGKEEPKDITGMNINEVVTLIRGKKGTEVRLTVKKVDGTIKTISIIRDEVVFDYTYARSLILDGTEAGERIGYIYLPSFYADFEDRNGRFSAEDVGKEIDKLKEEKVDGIILDLRNNGGGSLRDVIKMSGFFIEEGPIVQVKSRSQKPEVLMDVDPRVQYDGPLVVMVNEFSASASEILAAALQDYGRAVIVGNTTFGKGTVQRFYDLDSAIRGFNEIKPLGQLKLTFQKFYRINGGSTQLRGVTPDIRLPSNYEFIEVGEKEEDFAMGWTEIEPVKYKQSVFKISDLDKIKAKSAERVKESNTFQKILDNARRLQHQRDQSEYPLALDDYQAFAQSQEAEASKYKDFLDIVVNKGVANLEVDLLSIHADESKEARNEEFISNVSKDVYIQETLNIVHDIIANRKATADYRK